MIAQIDCLLPYASSTDPLVLDYLPKILDINNSSDVGYFKEGVSCSFG